MSAQVTISGMQALMAKIDKLATAAKTGVVREVQAFGLEVEGTAKTLAPADEGLLRNAIRNNNLPTGTEIVASTPYAAYMEFGTKQFAARYVATLPSDWQQVASQYKGGGGSFKDLLTKITEWVRRKGIDADPYIIAVAIARNGVEERPFLYPAFKRHEPQLIANIKNILNA